MAHADPRSVWVIEVRDEESEPWRQSGWTYDTRADARRAQPVAEARYGYTRIVKYTPAG